MWYFIFYFHSLFYSLCLLENSAAWGLHLYTKYPIYYTASSLESPSIRGFSSLLMLQIDMSQIVFVSSLIFHSTSYCSLRSFDPPFWTPCLGLLILSLTTYSYQSSSELLYQGLASLILLRAFVFLHYVQIIFLKYLWIKNQSVSWQHFGGRLWISSGVGR